MRALARDSGRLAGRDWFRAARLACFLACLGLLVASGELHAQCPATGQTKVFKPSRGTGYSFYKFLGESSYAYFLDGKTFRLNDKNASEKTFIFIDDFSFESTLVDRAELANYVQSTKDVDVLRAQAKHQQEYFKKAIPSMVLTDFGPSDPRDGRVFYLWKKESAPGAEAATQYLVSTLVKDGVVVLSMMLLKPTSEDAVFLEIQKYTAHFDLLSADRCAKALAAPIAP